MSNMQSTCTPDKKIKASDASEMGRGGHLAIFIFIIIIFYRRIWRDFWAKNMTQVC